MLDAFLETMAASPFEDGVADCGLTVADWVMEATGYADPALAVRGRYRTALGRERMVRRAGGLVSLVGRCANHAGLSETPHATSGDIGVIRIGEQILAGICVITSPGWSRWALKTSSGLSVVRSDEVLRAWRVGCRT